MQDFFRMYIHFVQTSIHRLTQLCIIFPYQAKEMQNGMGRRKGCTGAACLFQRKAFSSDPIWSSQTLHEFAVIISISSEETQAQR